MASPGPPSRSNGQRPRCRLLARVVELGALLGRKRVARALQQAEPELHGLRACLRLLIHAPCDRSGIGLGLSQLARHFDARSRGASPFRGDLHLGIEEVLPDLAYLLVAEPCFGCEAHHHRRRVDVEHGERVGWRHTSAETLSAKPTCGPGTVRTGLRHWCRTGAYTCGVIRRLP